MKAGAVMAKLFRDWFEPLNEDHLWAILYLDETGIWPEGFLPSDVFWTPGCIGVVRDKIEGRIPPAVRMQMEQFRLLRKIVSDIKFPDYTIRVEPMADEFYIQVVYDEPDVMTGVMETQEGRKWLLPSGTTEGQVVQTCFKAILTSLEHRAREHFTYLGRAVLNPHMPMETLLAIAPKDPHTEAIFKT